MTEDESEENIEPIQEKTEATEEPTSRGRSQEAEGRDETKASRK